MKADQIANRATRPAMGNGGSAEADLTEDSLAGEQLGAQADHETEHGQTTIPGFGEGHETEAGGGFSHGGRPFKKLHAECNEP